MNERRGRTGEHGLSDGGAGRADRRFHAVVFDLSGVVITSAFDAVADIVAGAESGEAALDAQLPAR